jgi:ABC-type phosphate/phosphonate transport system substrate-binding protein
LINGEVPAAVLALVSPQAAEWFPDIAGYRILRVPLSPVALQARLEPAGQVAASAAADPNAGKIQQQVTAATVIAEHVMTLRDAQKTTPASPNNDDRVVLLMTRLEIKSISDLAGKDIAIDDRHSASNDRVRSAIAAAGAAEVQLSERQTKAIDRLIAGEVPAAVLTLVYPETGFPQFAGFKIFRIPLLPRSVQARLETAGNAAAGSGTAPAKIPDSRPAGDAAANSNARTILEQVAAATALAEHVTAVAAPNDTDLLVALLMARPEIKSVSDLASKNIAIDDRQSASSDSVRTAIVAAGAGEVQLSEGQTKAISRLISGEVPAAVLTLVSPEAAEWFPDIAGFKIFRVPLSPRSLKARL